ncbi:MFS transporter [Pelagirhabdus alkalitolerans]|nr:MFS transporter [Pelagirhabdus alkalitolerans]
MSIYFLFSVFVVLQTAMDSQEVAFAKEVISLSDSEYGFLVSIAGAGILIGSLINVLCARKFTLSFIMGIGSIMVSVGYLMFAFSNHFVMASLGVFTLAFSLAFANTGFYTFYQNNIPVNVMGRVGSLYGFIEALLVIITTSVFAVIAHFISIQFTVVLGAIVMLILTCSLLLFSLSPSKTEYYQTDLVEAKEVVL